MRNRILYILVLLTIGYNSNGEIYSRSVVYTYSYSINRNDFKKEGKLYLGCLGKLWPIKEQNQMAVIWTTKLNELYQRICNTGVIENSERIWLHPPRSDEFSILEYSPFPEVRFPITLNKRWNWKLAIGEHWENKEYGILAEDTIKYRYEIREIRQIYPAFMMIKIECFEIVGVSTNIKKPTSFSGFFNSDYGFVKMVFKNIDSSVIELNLESIDKWEDFALKNKVLPLF